MGFISDLIEKILYEASQLWVSLFSNLGEMAFYAERGVDGILSVDLISKLYAFISGFAISLIVLKMLKKGFWTYILWRDGDPDAPLQQTVTNLILAVAAVLSFQTIYNWYADVSLWLIEKTLGLAFRQIVMESWTEVLTNLISMNPIYAIVMLIYMIMIIILYIQFLTRSAELLVLRLGFPLACLGLLDSDNGVFGSTVKVFIQVSLTTIVQLFLINLSVTIFLASTTFTHLLWCIAFCSSALGTPKMLQFIMLQNGGGGGGGLYKVTSTVHMVSMVKGLLPH